MRVLITGAFGFVGSRLAQYLHQLGYEVLLGSRNALESPSWLPDASVLKTEWDDVNKLFDVCCKCDVIVHSAGVNAKECSADPVNALSFNGLATSRLVDAACKAKVDRFIYLSTAHVYGNTLQGTVTEDTLPRNLHPYATSHLAGEASVLYRTQLQQLQGFVLRLSNAFGAPANVEANCWMLLVNDMCRQALTSRRMTLRSNGMHFRDFITLEDVSRAINKIIQLPSSEAKHHLFNVGSGKSQRIIDMVELIQSRCHYLYNFSPEIILSEPGGFETFPQFDYNIDKLSSLGFALLNNQAAEVDNLFRLCANIFSD